MISGEVVQAATANMGPKLQEVGILQRKSKHKRSGAMPLDWDSEAIKEDGRQRFSHTEKNLGLGVLEQRTFGAAVKVGVGQFSGSTRR